MDDRVTAAKPGADAPVLVVDDDRRTREVMAMALVAAGIEVVEATGGGHALELLAIGNFAAVVMDNHMPGVSGLDVLRSLRQQPETATLPVILVTGDDGTDERVAGLRTGASDYVVKPFDPDELVARVESQLRTQALWTGMIAAHHQERAAIAAALATTAVDATPEDTAWLICSEMERLGYPGVAVLAVAGRDRVVPLAVSGLAPWRLAVGRRLPEPLAKYLVDRAGHGPWIEYLDETEASSYAGGPLPDHVVLATAPMFAGHDLIGLFVVQAGRAAGGLPPAQLSRTLSETIDFAGIAAGQLGPALGRRSRRDQELRTLERIIEERSFTPVFQPIVRVSDGAVVGYEALTRFDDGVSPEPRFVAATELGLGLELELATITAAIAAERSLPGDGFVSLNISPAVALCGERLADALAPASRPVVLELTEHDRVDDYGALRDALSRLTPHVHVSIDDAGAGFASLRHVLELRPEFMKLDRSWIAGLDADPTRQALVCGLSHFSRATGCRLIAEGVERAGEASALQQFDVELGQGFLFGEPAPA
jgi:EAL domain-containing protein (putative c-di-GMP-specific phosphodiesterase class I)/CheY-like chemotaxis protein